MLWLWRPRIQGLVFGFRILGLGFGIRILGSGFRILGAGLVFGVQLQLEGFRVTGQGVGRHFRVVRVRSALCNASSWLSHIPKPQKYVK